MSIDADEAEKPCRTAGCTHDWETGQTEVNFCKAWDVVNAWVEKRPLDGPPMTDAQAAVVLRDCRFGTFLAEMYEEFGW